MEGGHRITEDMLTAALSKQFGVDAEQGVKVKSFDVTGGSKPGDNYACDMKAVAVVADVKGREDGATYFYMAKCFPMNEDRIKFLKETGLFLTESIMYTDIMPQLKQLDARIESPLTLYADNDKGVMLMENLKILGYDIIDKIKGMTMGEVKLVLTQLALLHATSHHIIQTHDGGEAGFRKAYSESSEQSLDTDSWISGDNKDMAEKMEAIFANNTDINQEIIQEFGTNRPDLARRVRAFTSVRRQRVDACHAKRGKFNCIIHNDSWYNNYMFRKDKASDTSTDVKTLDLQASRIARPSIDLAYFFTSSTKPAFRKDHLHSLLTFYHDIFVNKLNDLGYNGKELYSFDDLMEDFKECMTFGFVTGQLHTMVMLTPQEGSAKFDFDAALGDDAEAAARQFKEAQLKEARKNQVLRERLFELAEEAAQFGVI